MTTLSMPLVLALMPAGGTHTTGCANNAETSCCWPQTSTAMLNFDWIAILRRTGTSAIITTKSTTVNASYHCRVISAAAAAHGSS
jgi:hypothetical protein